MKRLVKSLLISLLIISTLGLNSVYAASHDINEIDEFLLETGMPLDIVKALDEEFKIYIYETIDKTKKLTFSGYTEKTITFPNIDDGDIRLNYIPPSELSLTVTSIVDSSGVYHIYPTFEWKVRTRVANDTFAFALPEGWYLVPSKYNLRMWARENLNDDWKLIEDLSRPSTATFYGYGWQIPLKYIILDDDYYVRGNAYFYAKPTISTPDRRICI
ncbi:MAG TPA: hypothetical protein VIK77_08090 [Tissierellaceae bacterium]